MRKLFLLLALAISAKAAEPIRALYITGGCCHEYTAQKKTLTEGIAARTDVVWTIEDKGETDDKNIRFATFDKPDWNKGYDIVVYNMCSGKFTNVDYINKIAAVHRETGLPAIVMHCAIHTFREAKTDEWRKLLGVTSMRHEKQQPFDVTVVKPGNPIMKGFPIHWHDPMDEQYVTTNIWPNTISLATAIGHGKDKATNTVVWANVYGKARVFGTTIGHLNSTMEKPEYLDMVTRGMLWACKRPIVLKH
jgi:type 1 glutamine amidotransferase